jgi:hypothetical protein
MKFIILLVIIFSINAAARSNLITLTGHIKDADNAEALKNVNISILNTHSGTSTDSLGNYSLGIKPGKYSIAFSHVGYETQVKALSIDDKETNIHLNISLKSSPYILNDVTVKANREFNASNFDTLEIKDIQNIPNLYSDVLKSVKILPGVTSNNELTSAYNVRGGNFDENLIYLDGYEIYRPYLIQQGVEENQSLINGNMVSSMEFYNGAFPAEFGDKMSSALAVNYGSIEKPVLGGEINADLFNLGLTLHDRTGNLSWITGIRYAYPSLFDETLQTKGLYRPGFNDFQFLGSYNLPNNYVVQLLFITARNKFELTPQSWFGNFQSSDLGGIQQVTLDFAGNSAYKYNTNLLGLKFIAPLSDNSSLTTSLAYYSDKEYYNTNLSYNVYYSEDAYHPQDNMQYLETGYEFADNTLNTEKFELMSDYILNYKTQTIKAGADIRYSEMESSLDESTSYLGADSVLNNSNNANQKLNTDFNSLSGYIEDNIFLNSLFNLNAGLRLLKYYFNGEFLLSPRAGIYYKPDTLNSFSFTWGYYYQPPYFYETWDKSLTVAKSYTAQKDVQYDLNWEYRFKQQSKFTAELYYKDLSRLIPYYIDQLQLTYGNANNYEGFAYGLDLQYEGELVQGLETWIGYSYLNAEERETPGNFPYENSPMNQTHTIRIFLQDNSKSHPNFQAHVLFLLGSGYYYYPMISVPGNITGSYQIVPDYNITREYPIYFRVDMGLTFEFNIPDNRKITFTAEVLNVFDQYNVTSYSWYRVFPETTQPVPVPNILSPRYFNAGFKFDF